MIKRRFYIQGIVQGVGFRPFVKRLADSLNINGYVINTSNGVEITAIAPEKTIDIFIKKICDDAPPLSHIISIKSEDIDIVIEKGFFIKTSSESPGITLVSPDTAMCSDCGKECESEGERRFGYAFTNCTNCGPRYSITEKLPYDRCNTVMKEFEMCSLCSNEYSNPKDRRFHAQPIACPSCGPNIYLNYKGDIIKNSEEAIKKAAQSVNDGEIIAMKGLGGYHLICDAFNSESIGKLRNLKKRMTKPLALMCKSCEVIKKYINIDEKYENLLNSPSAPIVIIPWENSPLSPLISPNSCKIGIMTAYTPLHYIFFKYIKTDFIVATSGNLRDEPIAKDNYEAENNLKIFTDIFLHHNRKIYTRLDDSVVSAVKGGYTIIRRSRGFAPYPVIINSDKNVQVFAAGANLKSSIALYKNGYAFLSQYLGDLDTPEVSDLYEETYIKMKGLFGIVPEIALHDIHPSYRSSIFAKNIGCSAVTIQHHAAHFASCLAENSFYGDALGIIMDGFGLGNDGEAWGGEFFIKKGNTFLRKGHLKKFIQPGGDSAAKNPANMLISYLDACGLLEDNIPILKSRINIGEKEINIIKTMCNKMINSIYTTSAGRLFEAIGSLLSGVKSNEYEGALAIYLENIADREEKGSYSFYIENNIINPAGVFSEIMEDIKKGVSEKIISARFHNGFVNALASLAEKLCSEYSIENAALSGGTFQNIRLLDSLSDILEKRGINVMTHKKVPANDGGIALGQLYYYLQDIEFI